MNREDIENQIIDLLDEENTIGALEMLNDYYETYGFSHFYMMALSDIYMKEGQYEDVVDLMRQGFSAGFNDVFLYERLGDAYASLDQYQDALDAYLVR